MPPGSMHADAGAVLHVALREASAFRTALEKNHALLARVAKHLRSSFVHANHGPLCIHPRGCNCWKREADADLAMCPIEGS